MAKTKSKDTRSSKPRSGRTPSQVVEALKSENLRLLQRIALLEALCAASKNRIKMLETKLNPNAQDKLTGDELEAILHAALETTPPPRRKRY